MSVFRFAFLVSESKSLSENLLMRDVMKTNESAGQLQKSLIRFTELFPADQETTPAIEPREKPFDDPSSRRFPRFQAVRLFLGRLIPLVVLPIESDVWLVASLIEFPIDGVMIIGRIQAQVLWMAHRWFRLLVVQRIQGREKQLAVMAIGSINTEGQWQPATVTQDAPFGSVFAAIGGSGTDGGMPRKGL